MEVSSVVPRKLVKFVHVDDSDPMHISRDNAAELWKVLREADWLMRLLYGDPKRADVEVRELVRYARHCIDVSLQEQDLPRSMPRSVAEMFDILCDASGKRLKELVECSLRGYAERMGSVSVSDSAEYTPTRMQTNAEIDRQVEQLVKDSSQCCDLITTMQHAVDAFDNDGIDKLFDDGETYNRTASNDSSYIRSRDGDEHVPAPMSTVEMTARYAYNDYASGTVNKRSVRYMQYIFMTMLNLHVRARGVRSNEACGEPCNYVEIVKEARDAFVLVCPLLWYPGIMDSICKGGGPSSDAFLFEDGSDILRAFYERIVAPHISCIITVNISRSSDNVFYRHNEPIGHFVRSLRAHYERIVRDKFFELQYRVADMRNRHRRQRAFQEQDEDERMHDSCK